MKKINKINKDKSKKLMERMFEKRENEDIDIFKMLGISISNSISLS